LPLKSEIETNRANRIVTPTEVHHPRVVMVRAALRAMSVVTIHSGSIAALVHFK
jgi:hypothetical protein